MTIWYLVRHGEVPSNREGRHIGQREEDLTEKGEQQAKDLSQMLADEPIDSIYSSPLSRARATAFEIRKNHQKVRFETDLRLSELHMGIFEGLHPNDARIQYPVEYREREKDKFHYVIPGGESYERVMERVKPAIRDIRKLYPEGKVCIVGHQGSNRAIIGELVKRIPTQDIPKITISPQEYIRIDEVKGVAVIQFISKALKFDLEERLQ
ncbi:histidine phosphatase family protein [Candidatus Woesearchaeota archaeon]|nr:histidine phosphatase family protein [Candidatus Woesearchaeota archaeon]